jgi:hypothetical protein
MQAFGSDRLRQVGGKLILLSAIPKGWTPRSPKTNTSAEYPGTTVLWDEQYFEVVEAVAAEGGRVRYVLVPWREEHTIRTFESYDAESEARRLADHELAARQRRASAASRASGFLLGHLPNPVQLHMQNELGVVPSRMTIASAIPPMVLFGICMSLAVGARIDGARSPIPGWLMLVAGFMTVESLVRITVALSGDRGIGSVLGTIGWLLFGRRIPVDERGQGLFTLEASEERTMSDALMMKAPLLTLLSRAEQQRLAERHGFDYRQHAYGPTWTMLAFAILGVVSSWPKAGVSATALLSLLVAGAVAVEQVFRLMQLPRGPAPSVFGVVVRPFVRDVLRS